ncbi:hypothetical protein HGRIS_005849 [Hohenbuehelia grisea]
MNEFGDTADIESKAINVSSPDDPQATSEEFLELANGCLCCSIKDLGVAAIEKLMQRKGAFDHILLETTGLADPGPIASMFWHNEELATGLGRDIALDGVICMVDAVFGKQQMAEDKTVDGDGESLRQIAGSDVILLNKADLAPEEQVKEVEDIIRGVNPVAPVYRTVRGNIDLKHIMGIGGYAAAPWSAPPTHDHTSCEGHDHGHEHAPGDHKHLESTHYEMRGISSLQVSVPVLSQARLDKVDEWIRSVLWEGILPEHNAASLKTNGGHLARLEVLRCKGLFILEGGVQHVLQGVRSLYEMTPVEGASGPIGVPDDGKLVLIGKGLDDSVRKSLETLLS